MRRDRSPRRAYDEEGREIAPPTLKDCRAQGDTTAWVWCHDCRHDATISTDRFPDDLPFPDIALHLRCSACNGRRVGVMMDIEAYYARLSAETGWKMEVKPWPGRDSKKPAAG
ncbi:hypothetical protein [Methylobacterium sp. Gmos1]